MLPISLLIAMHPACAQTEYRIEQVTEHRVNAARLGFRVTTEMRGEGPNGPVKIVVRGAYHTRFAKAPKLPKPGDRIQLKGMPKNGVLYVGLDDVRD
ncbi:MAG: hypothetical protein KIT11_08530 [Fimbriimonadaceae bacterium]|nr:hypothetical protein [Fimbriimonadaceae bacterium]QYK56399.1 MAG: hypothetical protein KF733_02725 [Fimbriimonadaceae bacterium]